MVIPKKPLSKKVDYLELHSEFEKYFHLFFLVVVFFIADLVADRLAAISAMVTYEYYRKI